jgi:hypothetical protein
MIAREGALAFWVRVAFRGTDVGTHVVKLTPESNNPLAARVEHTLGVDAQHYTHLTKEAYDAMIGALGRREARR